MTAERTAVQRITDALLHRGPGYDASLDTPTAEPTDRWQALAAALNAIPALGIDLDGTITSPEGRSVVWDHAAERWTVGDEDDGDEVPAAAPDADEAESTVTPVPCLPLTPCTTPWRHGAHDECAGIGTTPACGRCRRPFDPADTRSDGRARYAATPWCRSCVDACYETSDAFHRCVICCPEATR